MDRRCSFLHCGKPSVVALGDYDYCLVHFILVCYRHLDQSPDLRRQDQEHEGKAEARTRSLVEIIDQATSLSLTTGELTNQERGQLLDIVFWASDLLSDGRR
jgi:hypothetical protein